LRQEQKGLSQNKNILTRRLPVVSRTGRTISTGIRKHFFTERVVAPWNSLPADTDFSSLNRFKRCINAVDFRKLFS